MGWEKIKIKIAALTAGITHPLIALGLHAVFGGEGDVVDHRWLALLHSRGEAQLVGDVFVGGEGKLPVALGICPVGQYVAILIHHLSNMKHGSTISLISANNNNLPYQAKTMPNLTEMQHTHTYKYNRQQTHNHCFHQSLKYFLPGMRSRDIFGRLRLRLRGSIPAPAPAPSKTVRRLRIRAKCTGSGGSGSGDQVLIWALTRNTVFKNANSQNITSYWLGSEFEYHFEWVSLKFVTRCHPRPLDDIGEVADSFGLRCLRLVPVAY